MIDTNDSPYAYLYKAAAQAERRSKRRTVIVILIGIFFGLSVMAAAGFLAAEQQRAVAEQRRLIAEKEWVEASSGRSERSKGIIAINTDHSKYISKRGYLVAATSDVPIAKLTDEPISFAQFTSDRRQCLPAVAGLCSSDQRRIIIGSGSNIIIFDERGAELNKIRVPDTVLTAQFFNKNVVAGLANGTVGVWSVTGQVLRQLSLSERFIRSVAVCPDGTLLLTESDNGLDLWDFRSGKLVSRVRAPSNPSIFLGFSEDGAEIIVGYADSIVIWDVASGERRSQFSTNNP
jgi:WD40 repeat protein